MIINQAFKTIALILISIFLNGNTLFSQSIFLKDFRIVDGIHNSPFPPSNSVSHIAIQNSRIYIGTGNGLAKSTDGGRSWISYWSVPSFTNAGIFAITTYGDTVWTSTGYDQDINGGSVQTGSGYTFSPNGDSGWQHLPQTIDNREDSILSYCFPEQTCINDSISILPVIVPEQNVTFDISLTSGTVWIASWASGLRKSTDNGKHWQRILLPLDYMNSIAPTDTLWYFALNDTLHQHRRFLRFDPRENNNLLAFSVLASGNDTVWCGTAGGVNKSTDGGRSWTKYSHQNQASPILGNWVITIKQQESQSIKRLWTTNWRAQDNSEEFGVSYTEDDGKTWTNLLHGIRAYDFAFRDSIAYIATDEGIFRTEDGGRSFVKISDLIDPTTHHAIMTAQVFAVDCIGDTVYVGTNEGFASTIDNQWNLFGSSWNIDRTYEPVGISKKTYAYPNPFAPQSSLPSPDAYVRIHYGINEDGNLTSADRYITIEIFDFGMNRIRTLLKDAKRSASMEFDELWDGRDDHNDLVANGVYFYTIKVDNDEPIYGKILVLQ